MGIKILVIIAAMLIVFLIKLGISGIGKLLKRLAAKIKKANDKRIKDKLMNAETIDDVPKNSEALRRILNETLPPKQIYLALAKLNDMACQTDMEKKALIQCYFDGIGTKQDIPLAMDMVSKQAAMGKVWAKSMYALRIFATSSDPEKIEKAYDMLEALVTDDGDANLPLLVDDSTMAEPAYFLAMAYLETAETEEEKDRGYTLMLQSALGGCKLAVDFYASAPEEAVRLGKRQYDEGYNAESEKAYFKNVLKASKYGHAPSLLDAGMFYLEGNLAKDTRREFCLVRLADQLGSEESTPVLCRLYGDPGRIGKNFTMKEAESYLTAKSEAGDPYATYYLAGYIMGRNKNDPRGFLMFKKAAYAGIPQAMHSLAQCYEHGIGTPKDPNAAAYWEAKSKSAKNAPPERPEVEEPEGSEAMERKKKSIAYLTKRGIAVLESLPCVESSCEVTVKDADAILKRAIACFVSAQVACDLQNGTNVEESRTYFKRILQKFDADLALLPKEQLLFEGGCSEDDVTSVAWTYECCWALLWALGMIETDELIGADSICDCEKAAGLFRGNESLDAFKAKAKVRSTDEILDMVDLFYRYHWACVEHRLNPKASIGDLNPEVVEERRRGLEWLISDEADWFEISLDT